ncbi:periplasmic heavy metal sensor [Neogemmobacter tilapiae]|uniref:Periplasmic heavy metal sensor n=1 Tax=Neogemmobacter tilapiae TaxID=875041 RepID=A0A918TN90_9RHOB|nr:periplasmic heavy metal sensor [Gemmobacter tilapiae]GHC54519.1 hypothetical protein GCM10007315_16800 [Gemmobacter tilapiae]
MSEQSVDPVAKPPRNRWRMAFFTLLAVNLGVMGLMAGAVMRDGGPRERMIKDLAFGPFTEALSEEDRKELRQGFLRKLPDFRADRMAMRADALALIGVLRADPYDPAALRAALDQVQGRMQSRVAVGRDLLLERIDAMDVAARQAFADRLEAGLRHGGGKKGD